MWKPWLDDPNQQLHLLMNDETKNKQTRGKKENKKSFV